MQSLNGACSENRVRWGDGGGGGLPVLFSKLRQARPTPSDLPAEALGAKVEARRLRCAEGARPRGT